MKIKSSIALIVILASFIQHVSSKPTPTKPEWLMNRPINPEFYIGIGTCNKKSNINSYQQTTKNNALNDLAGEIHVNISNTSLLYTLSVNNTIKETFDSKTSTSINESLEGYELVDTYEDEFAYWAYYKLSRIKYAEIKQQRIQKAVDSALSKFETAVTYENQQQYYNALILLIKSIEDIKPYLSESLRAKYNDKEIYLGNEIFNKILHCLSELKIWSLQKEITVKKGQPIKSELLSFTISDRNGNKIENIPIIVEFTGGAIINDRDRTSTQGVVSFSIPKIKSKKSIEYFTAKIDFNSILQDATNDYLIRKLLRNVKQIDFQKQINIQNPIFFVTSADKNNQPILEDAFTGSLTPLNLEITKNQKDADFIVDISSNTFQSTTTNYMCKVSIEVTIIVKNQTSKILYQRNISDINGIQSTFDSAKSEAYRNAVEYIANRIVADIIDQLF